MQQTKFLAILTGILIFSGILFAQGNQQCDLTIQNKTWAHVNRIVIIESEAAESQNTYNRSIENNQSTVIKIKQNTLYDIVLIDLGNKQYAKKNLAWIGETASVSFGPTDLQLNDILDKAGAVGETVGKALVQVGIFAGKALKTTGEEVYNRIGGSEGIKNALQVMGKFSQDVLQKGINFTIEAGKVVARVTRETMEQIQQEELKKLNNEERKILNDNVQWEIVEEE